MKRLFMGNIFFTLAENAQQCGTCIRADFMDSPQIINIGGQALMFRVGARPDLLQGRCIDAFRKPLPGPGRIHEELLRGSDRDRDQAQEGDDDRQRAHYPQFDPPVRRVFEVLERASSSLCDSITLCTEWSEVAVDCHEVPLRGDRPRLEAGLRQSVLPYPEHRPSIHPLCSE
jgi:hypothetical protein